MENELTLKSITKNDCETIGFVLACAISGAINIDELRLWAEHVIGKLDSNEVPAYIYDLLDFDGPLFKVYSILGFTPGWKREKEEDLAIYGIAIARGREVEDIPVPRQKTVQCLENNPRVKNLFEGVFPFLSSSYGAKTQTS